MTAHSMPWGPLRGGLGKVQVDSEQQDLGNIPLLGFVDGMLCGSWAKPGFVNSEQKMQVLVSFQGLLFTG